MSKHDPSESLSLGAMIKIHRGAESTRDLAARSSVSQAQISRIENGLVAKPSREIVTALARALGRHPTPLLVLAGHLTGKESQRSLRWFFGEGKEVPLELTETLEAARDALSADLPDDAVLRAIAADISLQDLPENEWQDVHALASIRGEEGEQLNRVMEIWSTIGRRRADLIAYGETLERLAELEWVAELKVIEKELEQRMAAADTDEP